MKTWLFALLQSVIACLGLAAYFYADSIYLAGTAAVLAAALGIAQPLITAHKSRKLEAYRDKQWASSIDTVDEQLASLLEDVIEPPVPHRATVTAALRNRFGDRTAELAGALDELVDELQNDSGSPGPLASSLATELGDWALGPYMLGLAALRCDDVEAAHEHFRAARDLQSTWILPWVGWATTAFRRELWNELRDEHPHICGVELLPYGSGNEETFLELGEADREELTRSFQQAATCLGNYYAIAEMNRSRQQIADSHEEYKKVA